MGAESVARRKVGGTWVTGRALLETDELLFRGDPPLRARFRDLKDLAAAGRVLRFTVNGERHELELERDAAAWLAKIQNPKTRVEKLNLEAGAKVALSCISDETFRPELEARGIEPTIHDRGLDAFIVGVGDESELRGFKDWSRRIAPTGGVWVVYPKGRKEVTEAQVLAAGRGAGLVDVKVVRFSDTHTALKFVVPRSARA